MLTLDDLVALLLQVKTCSAVDVFADDLLELSNFDPIASGWNLVTEGPSPIFRVMVRGVSRRVEAFPSDGIVRLSLVSDEVSAEALPQPAWAADALEAAAAKKGSAWSSELRLGALVCTYEGRRGMLVVQHHAGTHTRDPLGRRKPRPEPKVRAG